MNSLRTLRFHNWWNSKIPQLLSYGYAVMLIQGIGLEEVWWQLLLLLVWMIGAAAFGHYVNDVYDLKDDLLAGKENNSRLHTTNRKIAIISSLALLTLLPWLLLPKNTVNLALVFLHLIIFFMYSAPPVRLKERKLLSVFTDSVYAHLIPATVVVATLWTGDVLWLLLGCFLAWQFLIGCRNILNHHIDDYPNDKLSGTVTSATVYGVAKVKRAVKLMVIPLELAAFIAIMYLLGNPLSSGIWLFLAYIVYTFYREVTFLKGKLTKEVEVFGRYDYLSGIMLNEYYEKWLPVVLLILLTVQHSGNGILLVAHLLLFIVLMKSFVRDLSFVVYLIKEAFRTTYYGIEKYIRHFFQSTLPSIRDNGYWETRKFFQRIYYSIGRMYWRMVVLFRRIYWAWIAFYRDHIVRIAWIVIKFYYRVEYKLWKMFYKPLKDRWKSGK